MTIVGPDGASDVQASTGKSRGMESRYMRAFFAVRSRYAEDQLAEALKRGVTQYVVLGAGLDTFAYRNPYAGRDLRVFEVDHPATQAWKRNRLETTGIPVPADLTYVPVDFEKRAVPECLSEAGFQRNAPTFFSWLGVTPYLTPEAFNATVGFPTGA